MALGYAAIALAVLAIFLPVVMIKTVRKDSRYEGTYRVKGGNVSLALVSSFGVLIVAAQFLITVGYLPSLG